MQDNGTALLAWERWIRFAMRGLFARAEIIWCPKGAAALALILFGLGGCVDVKSSMHDSAAFVGLATNPKEGPDFVKQSQPENTDYTSVGVETAKPPDKPRDAAGIKQLQAELEAQRAAGHALLQSMSPQAAATPDPKAKGAESDKKAKKKKPDETKKQDKQAQDTKTEPPQ
jgi:hypothetical protein